MTIQMNSLPTADPYADCRNAIEFEEGVIEEAGQVYFTFSQAVSVDQLLEASRVAADEAIAKGSSEVSERAKKVRAEYDLPSFRRWIMARVYGAM